MHPLRHVKLPTAYLWTTAHALSLCYTLEGKCYPHPSTFVHELTDIHNGSCYPSHGQFLFSLDSWPQIAETSSGSLDDRVNTFLMCHSGAFTSFPVICQQSVHTVQSCFLAHLVHKQHVLNWYTSCTERCSSVKMKFVVSLIHMLSIVIFATIIWPKFYGLLTITPKCIFKNHEH